MKPGLKLLEGHPAGRDPREMAQDELRAAGHAPMSPLQAIRARCLDCCGDQEREVALCTAVKCPSWQFRMGTDPWRKPGAAGSCSAGDGKPECAPEKRARYCTGRQPSGARDCTVSDGGFWGGAYLGYGGGRRGVLRRHSTVTSQDLPWLLTRLFLLFIS